MKLLIWWTNQGDCEAIDAVFPDGLPEWLPQYVADQLCDRYGLSGRGSLWVDPQFGVVSVNPWPNTALAEILATYAGIVIREWDACILADMPGVITNLQLRRV